MGYDVITIGSATVDVFAHTHASTCRVRSPSGGKQEMLMYPSGEKIYIKKLDFHTGGGGTNTAAGFAKLGLKVGYIGQIGKDENGTRVLNDLKKRNISFLGKRGKEMTGYSVILDSVKHDRTILVHKGANNFLRYTSSFGNNVKKAKLLYCGSMLGISFSTAEKLVRIASKTSIPIVFNPSSYQTKMGRRKLSVILKATHTLIFNKEEACMLLKKDPTKKQNLKKILLELHKLGPREIIITDGKNETYASDGEQQVTLTPKNIPVCETTGAGDGFAVGYCTGLLWKKDFRTRLQMGAHQAESIIQHYGAKQKLLNKTEMHKLLKKFKHKIKKL